MYADKATDIRLLIVDDHPVVRSGVANMLKMHDGMIVVGSTGSGQDALCMVTLHKPHVMLLDLRMPGMDGMAVLQALSSLANPPRVLVLTSYEQDELIYQAIKGGAMGYLMKDTSESELVAAIRSVRAGKRYIPFHIGARLADRMLRLDLTPRELQTLELLANGSTNKQIAKTLRLSNHTIQHYVSSIMEKLEVSDRTEAVAIAFKSGLLQNPGTK